MHTNVQGACAAADVDGSAPVSNWLCGCREKERLHDAARLETLKLEAAAEQQRWEAYEVGVIAVGRGLHACGHQLVASDLPACTSALLHKAALR